MYFIHIASNHEDSHLEAFHIVSYRPYNNRGNLNNEMIPFECTTMGRETPFNRKKPLTERSSWDGGHLQRQMGEDTCI